MLYCTQDEEDISQAELGQAMCMFKLARQAKKLEEGASAGDSDDESDNESDDGSDGDGDAGDDDDNDGDDDKETE